VVTGSALILALSVGVGVATAATTFPDRAGDVKGAGGPDLTSITVSDTATTVTFSVRFAKAPPLRVNAAEKWIDMLLIGVDVPPLGPRPTPSGWRGVDFVLGLHGSQTAVRFRKMDSTVVEHRKLVVTGAALSFSIPRAKLGSPAWFDFSVAAARETEETGQGGGEDYAPASGAFRYRLTRAPG